MESMRRSEENISRHPNKVATNNSTTTGNNSKHCKLVENISNTTDPVCSTINKKLYTKSQLQQGSLNNIIQSNSNKKIVSHPRILNDSKNSSEACKNLDLHINISSLKTTTTTSSLLVSSIPSSSNESKDTNFEYEDEWDIGGIPKLLDDLDADIEKSSSVEQLGSEINNSGGGNNSAIKKSHVATLLCSGINSKTDPLATFGAAISKQRKELDKTFTTVDLSKEFRQHSHPSSYITTNASTAISDSFISTSDKDRDKKSAKFANYSIAKQQVALRSYKPQEVLIPKLVKEDKSKGVLAEIVAFHSTNNNEISSSSLGNSQKANKFPASNFIGFAKEGNLVSTQGNSLAEISISNNTDIFTTATSPTLPIFHTTSAMSSQSSGGSGNNNSSSGGGTSSNQINSQNSGNPANISKSNAKMSIDHQATLDKGLKMKIKRTKPGTKTSEAKHEIVKATEQQQNGTLGSSSSSGLDESVGPSSSSHTSTSSNINNNGGSNTSVSTGSSTNVGNSNKKHVANMSNSSGNNNSNQNNSHSSGNGNSSGSGSGSSNNIAANNSVTTPQSTKRGSSGHRRDKAKEKTQHSNRLAIEKTTTNIDKESSNSVDKSNGCQCNGDTNANGSSCNNHGCIRRSETSNNTVNILTQRMSNSTSGSTTAPGSVPPGVFTPSIGSPAVVSSSATSSLITVTTVTASTSSSQPTLSLSGSNAPGPPGKDISTSGNLKISSHIAAQLAAVSASHTFNNNSSGGNGEGKPNSIASTTSAKLMAPGMISATVHHTMSMSANPTVNIAAGVTNNSPTCSIGPNVASTLDDGIKSPPAKRSKHSDHSSLINASSKEMVDICIGTSVGTITEPDCLGPCEPGTSVTLEGIVWHETEGGVLVVNVTWRGKTYVGTLLDCTRHDWAPPRFCDSPTEELDSRTPKGRGKRGRSAVLTPDLSNFTETRSSIYFSHAQVHSKLRNGAAKGRGTARSTVSGTNATTTTTITSSSSSGNGGGATPSTSPTAFLPPRSEKRKSKDESPSPLNGDNDGIGNVANASGIAIANNNGSVLSQPQSLVNPVTGLNVQISTKKCKTASPCAISPVLLECPEQDCSKKYKHANGLRYHQSAAHGSIGSMDEDSLQLPEESPTTPSPGLLTQPAVITIPIAPETESMTSNTTCIESPGAPSATSVTNIVATTSANSPLDSSLQPPPSQLSQQSSPVIVSNTDSNSIATATMSGPNTTSITNGSDTITVSSSVSSVLLTATQAASLPPPLFTSSQQHSVAGGSITAGISSQMLSQQQSIAITNAANMTQILSEQQQALLQGSLKGSVLRFGQPNDTPSSIPASSMLALQQQAGTQGASLVGMQTNTLPGQNTLRAQPQLIPTSEALQSHQTQSSINPYTSGTISSSQSLQQAGFPVTGKQKKCRKSPGPGEYEGGISRDDVQSPAYSDISDDSTPVVEQEILDKSQPNKHLDLLNKKPVELGPGNISGGSQTIPTMGNYGMYQFYQQQQYMVPSSDAQPTSASSKALLPPVLSQQAITLPTQSQQQGHPSSHHLQQSTHVTDYANKNKDPPLDLITKPVNSQPQSLGQQHLLQDSIPNQKENPSTQPLPSSVGLNNIAPPSLGGLALTPTVGPGGLSTPTPTKPISHFYPFNYMTPGYPYNVEPNYGSISIVSPEDTVKMPNHGGIPTSQSQNPTSQHQGPSGIKDDRTKESPSPHDSSKMTPQQMVSAKIIKTEPVTKQEVKSEANVNVPQTQQSSVPQQPHALHPKDLQGLGTYPNIYQRHPMSLAAQQHLSREEELRRYYILSEEQRRATIRAVQAQTSSTGVPSASLQSQMTAQHKDDGISTLQHSQQLSINQQHQQNIHQQQQQKSKSQSSNSSINIGGAKMTNLNKEVQKPKQDEEVKIKQEGQKPTMETQGPPPPPTSQYFLHPSYIAPAPFSFDPNHPMYRNVLMSAAGPYNAPPYHLPIPRYHAPEDLSRNAGTKALDVLHHAASQYYTTHKIHELSERALKSPTSSAAGPGSSVKVTVSSPSVCVQQQSSSASNAAVTSSGSNSGSSGPNNSNLLSTSNQPGSGTNLALNLQPPPNTMSVPAGKSDVLSQKTVSGGSSNSGGGMVCGPINIEPLKQQGGNVSSGSVAVCNNASGNAGSSGNCGGTTTDSRSPPPQRHVHTHHHTHVGLGYPMYTAPYGAAVLASQQAAAVAVINPFPPGPTK